MRRPARGDERAPPSGSPPSSLRALEQAGIVLREQAPPPLAATIFKLTPRGEELRPVLDALSRWGVPYMVEGPAEADSFRARWLAWPAERFLEDRDPEAPAVAIELRTGEEPMVLEAAGWTSRTHASWGCGWRGTPPL